MGTRFALEVIKLVDDLAELEGLSRSDFIRIAAKEKLDKAVAKKKEED